MFPKTILFELLHFSDIMCLTVVTQLAHKHAKFDEISQNNDHYAV